MDELAVAESNADVRRARADGLEEHEISRFDVLPCDRLTDAELCLYVTWQLPAVLREDVADEAAAVEAGRIGAAVAIGRPT
jgi:hypothetical protein